MDEDDKAEKGLSAEVHSKHGLELAVTTLPCYGQPPVRCLLMRLLWTQRERGPGQLIHKTLPETYYLLKPETRMR